MKSEETFLKYPDLGMDISEWILVGHGDCGVKSMPDKITSVGGYVVTLRNKRTNACCVLVWKSKKIRRKVISTLAGEALAMIGVIGEIVYTKAVLVQMFGTRANDIPTLVLSDCKNLTQAIKSTSLVEDPWLIPDIAIIKDALEYKKSAEVNEVTEDPNVNNICNICAAIIRNYCPEHFCGESYNPTCENCKANDNSWIPDDPFASFPSPHQPSSLVSHWIPANMNTPQRPGSISSMIVHCPYFPPPGSSFISMEEVLDLMREFFKRPLFGYDEE